MSIRLDDSIVALATPPGVGALGVIRLSGPGAFDLADAVFRGKTLSAQPANTVHYGKIVRQSEDAAAVVDEVVATLFRAPRSFTGEDVVEFSCHGSPHVLSQVLQVLVEAGARPAAPGEFTQRAFLHGKLDLTQAEAVADLIAAESEAARKTALHQLRGGFSAALRALRDELLHVSALMELELDFSEEDVEFADRRQLHDLLARIGAEAASLIQSFRLGNVLKNGVRVAILGAPNAGKSTLLNALLCEERAIVSEVAGTTRDAIEATMHLQGILYRFVDTAGIREKTDDTIEQQGIARALDNAATADLILYIIDASAGTGSPDALPGWLEPHAGKVLAVYNKWDRVQGALPVGTGLPLSAQTGAGLEALHDALHHRVQAFRTAPGDTVVTNTRHLAALQGLAAAVADVQAGLDAHLPGDLIALDLRRALHFIGEITGTVTVEDTLDAVFSKFCIGK